MKQFAGNKVFMRIVSVCLFVFIILTIFVFFSMLFFMKTVYKNSLVCSTKTCNKMGESLLNSINESVNPCENFYDFACGKWIKNHPISEYQSEVTELHLLSEKLEKNIDSVLKKNLSKKLTSKSTSVQLAIDLYEECHKLDMINSRGVEPLKKLIGNWPDLNEKIEIKDLADKLAHYFILFGSNPFFELSVSFTLADPEVKKLILRPVKSDVMQFLAHYAENKKIMSEVANFFSPNLTQNIQNHLKEILLLEYHILSSTSVSPPNLLLLKDLKNLTVLSLEKGGYPFNYSTFLNTIAKSFKINEIFTDNYLITVYDEEYFQKIFQVLSENSPKTIHNYLNWKAIEQFLFFLDDRSRSLVVKNSFYKMGTRKFCVSLIQEHLSFAAARLYVEHFVKKETKKQLTVMLRNIKETFKDILLHQIHWLDNKTINKAIEKLSSMRENLVYPDWIFSDRDLDSYYAIIDKKLKIKSNEFFEGLLLVIQIKTRMDFVQIDQVKKPIYNFNMSPITVNAAYFPLENSLTIPAAILKPPFFDPDRPSYINYASIGMVAGHEITHGFDNTGRRFNKDGKLNNWWTAKTLEKFLDRLVCFAEQYQSIYDNATELNLNGVRTVSENVADNGGLKQAYLAYKKILKNKNNDLLGRSKMEFQLLPYFSKYSRDQVFFLSFAAQWCQVLTLAKQIYIIKYNLHLPFKYRVNLSLKNFNFFAEAFQCPAGSPMNPRKKCSIW